MLPNRPIDPVYLHGLVLTEWQRQLAESNPRQPLAPGRSRPRLLDRWTTARSIEAKAEALAHAESLHPFGLQLAAQTRSIREAAKAQNPQIEVATLVTIGSSLAGLFSIFGLANIQGLAEYLGDRAGEAGSALGNFFRALYVAAPVGTIFAVSRILTTYTNSRISSRQSLAGQPHNPSGPGSWTSGPSGRLQSPEEQLFAYYGQPVPSPKISAKVWVPAGIAALILIYVLWRFLSGIVPVFSPAEPEPVPPGCFRLIEDKIVCPPGRGQQQTPSG